MEIAAGIGLFLALIALKNAGIVVGDRQPWSRTASSRAPVVMAALGFELIVALEYRSIHGRTSISGSWLGDGGGHRRKGSRSSKVSSTCALDRPGIPAGDLGGAIQVGLVRPWCSPSVRRLFDNTGHA